MTTVILTAAVAILGFAAGVVTRRYTDRRRRRQPAAPNLDAEIDQALQARFPGSIRTHDGPDLILRMGESEARLPYAELRTRMEHYPGRASMMLAHFMAETDRALRRPPLGADFTDANERLVPVLLPTDRAERTDHARRLTLSISPGLDVGFVIDDPATNEWVTIHDATSWKMEAEALFELSVLNLWRKTEGAVVVQEQPAGKEVYRIAVGDGLDAARILLRPLWQKVGERCGEDLVFCMPTRDRMYAAPRSQQQSLELMAQRLCADWQHRSHQISPRMWVWTEDQLEPWKMNA